MQEPKRCRNQETGTWIPERSGRMKTKRVLSTESFVYHRANCPYVKRIYEKNKMILPKAEAREHGYRPCKCCNTMGYLYLEEQCNLDYFGRKWNMEFLLLDGILYVKTPVGCWKLVYSKKEEKIALYHRNDSDEPVCFDKPQNEHYHRQTDCANARTITSLCTYIYEHDRFREAQKSGRKLTSFTSERSRIMAVRTERKEARKRLDSLFLMLEESNAGFRKLSFC